MIGIIGLGAIGRIIASDLHKFYNGKVVYIVRDKSSVNNLAKKFNAEVRFGDVNDPDSLVNAFKNLKVVIHAVHHEYNIAVMKACLKADCNYIDLGGLYHFTKKQLKLFNRFKKKNLLAIIGMGASPGITNVMASYGFRFFKEINNIQFLIGSEDFSTYKKESPLTNLYSIQTIIEEFSWKPAVFVDGKTIFVEPISGREEYKFPSPVGSKKPQFTIHSEIATIPYNLKSKNVSFKIAFDDSFVDKILTLKRIGFTVDKDIKIKDNKVNIMDTLVNILKKLPRPIPKKLNQYEIIRVIISGFDYYGYDKQVILDARIESINETVNKDTGVPPSIVSQMIVNNLINKSGVFPPELIINDELFFDELFKRNILIFCNDRRIN